MAGENDPTEGPDLEWTKVQLEQLEKLARRFGTELTGALQSATVSGRSLDEVLRRIGINLAGMALQQGLQPLKSLSGSFFANLVQGVARSVGFAQGGVPGRALPFAEGGVVSSPTYFPIGGKVGLMGEAGAEAILPLSRGSDGRLGISTAGAGGQVNIVFNVNTPDAASFQKSEAQMTGLIARAASRGLRNL